MNTDQKLEAGLIFILLFFGSVAAVGSVPAPSDVYFTGETVQETLRTTATNVTTDSYMKDGDASKIFAKWTVIGKENGEVVEEMGSDWQRIYINQEGDASFQKVFQFQPSETGNYTLSVMIAKTDGTYDQQKEEWNWYNTRNIAVTSKSINVVERGTMSILGQGFDKRMSMMAR